MTPEEREKLIEEMAAVMETAFLRDTTYQEDAEAALTVAEAAIRADEHEIRHLARLTYASYWAWDRAQRAGTCHGSSEGDRFETNLDALMEALDLVDELKTLGTTNPADIQRSA